MKNKRIPTNLIVVVLLLNVSIAIAFAQDRYTLKVPNGLAFSEFKGYESWQLVSISQDGNLVAAILANPVMIKAYQEGIPGNGKPFPDGARMQRSIGTRKKWRRSPQQLCQALSTTSTLW